VSHDVIMPISGIVCRQ